MELAGIIMLVCEQLVRSSFHDFNFELIAGCFQHQAPSISLNIALYRFSFSISSLCVPLCCVFPFSKIQMVSAPFAIFRRCVIKNMPVFTFNLLSKNRTKFSMFLSIAAVGSSKSRSAGFRHNTLAKATSCFCPPDIFMPSSPSRVA